MGDATDIRSTKVAAAKAETFAKRRRKLVKNTGRKLTRTLSNFLGRQSLVGDTPIISSEFFPHLREIEKNWRAILKEVQQILQHRDTIPAFHDVSPDQHKISTGTNWRTFILFGFGERLDKNCAQAPETTRLLSAIPNIQTAWFSILSPGYHIRAHKGVSKGILRAHLGLLIPKDAEKCRIRVGDVIKVWQPGEIFVFDDTYEHEVWNDTNEERVILLFDFDRPMRFWGRFVTKLFIRIMKLTAFYQEPKKNMMDFQARFEAAAKRYNDNLEKMSHHD
jgi:aspartyl/asparaginyl beta-hydroxylase (cupin superfamily)